MATLKTSNKGIAMIVGATIVLAIALFAQKKNDDNVASMPEPQEATVPDGDSTADTLRTLTAELKRVREENEENSKKMKAIEKTTSKQKKPELDEEMLNEKMAGFFADHLSQISAQPTDTSDYDFDLGDTEAPKDEIVWIDPVDEVTVTNERGEITTIGASPFSGFGSRDVLGDSERALESPIGQALTAGVTGNAQDTVEPDLPIYTIPKNATLIDSTAMSAMIGRIPSDGNVEDPYPIKVITGKNNLAANGLDIPEISHMIFTGTAVGDWTLSCVRADITSVTYVFEDGTIRTLTAGDDKVNANNRLAWISDQRGIPCVSGKRISNASANLMGQIFAKGVEAGAGAIAKAEETNVTSAQGDTTSSVTGDVLTNTAYKAVSGGSKAISEWLNKREAQNFDVIYVDTGAKVNINIDAELPIDYEPNGRKLRHENNTPNRFASSLD